MSDHQADPSPRESAERELLDEIMAIANDWGDPNQRQAIKRVLDRTTRTSPQLSDGMVERAEAAAQRYWDNWCSDTGHVPSEFHIAGPRTTRVYADFRASGLIAAVLEALADQGNE